MPSAQLSGFASDDGLPSNYLITAWSMVSNPPDGTVVFANSNALMTTATFDTNGLYELQLWASDGQLTNASVVWIEVLVTNRPPVVFAGPSQTLILPAPLNTNLIPTITLTTIADNIPSPIDVDYFPPSNSVILTVNYNSGVPYNFELVDTNGNTNAFTSIGNLSDEVYTTTARTTNG